METGPNRACTIKKGAPYKGGAGKSRRDTASPLPPQTIQLSPGSIGAVSTDLDLPVVRNLSIYEDYLKDKLLTFVLEISSGTNTVRVAGWDLPKTDWLTHHIRGAYWGYYDISAYKEGRTSFPPNYYLYGIFPTFSYPMATAFYCINFTAFDNTVESVQLLTANASYRSEYEIQKVWNRISQ